MENKNKIIITMAILAIAVVITAVLLTVMNKSNNEEANNLNIPQGNSTNGANQMDAAVPEYFDVDKIIESQITENENMSNSQISILESPIFSIPKDVSDIEMMTKEEKSAMGIDENLNVQILGRNEAGQVTGYQFIYSEEDFVIDLR